MKVNNESITVIGLGVMGSTLVKSLLNKQHPVTIWNRSIDKTKDLERLGATVAPTFEEAIAASDLILICVSTYGNVYELLNPVIEKLKGKQLVNLSSGTYLDDVEMDKWAQSNQFEYLSGAAMSGTQLVGQEEALFIYSGAQHAYDRFSKFLQSFGQAVFLGTHPGHASLYDSSLYSVIWGALTGFFQGAALLNTKDVKPQQFAAIAVKHLPFIAILMEKYARQIENKNYLLDEGSLTVNAGAMDHLVQSSVDMGINPGFPQFTRSLIEKAISKGHSENGIASVYEVIQKDTV
jgi:3-hydroxyisobutyrate dehydrogenase-like beta-hydroxyacid dehydrogenase